MCPDFCLYKKSTNLEIISLLCSMEHLLKEKSKKIKITKLNTQNQITIYKNNVARLY